MDFSGSLNFALRQYIATSVRPGGTPNIVLIIIFITTEIYINLFCIVSTDIIKIVQFPFILLVLSFLNLTLNS